MSAVSDLCVLCALKGLRGDEDEEINGASNVDGEQKRSDDASKNEEQRVCGFLPAHAQITWIFDVKSGVRL